MTTPPSGASGHRGLGMVLFLLFLLLSLLAWLKAGFIAANGGAGFDGAYYLHHIIQVARGRLPVEDPYRLIRMPGFLPAISAVYLGLPAERIVAFQAAVNALTLAAAAVAFHGFIERLTASAAKAAVATGVLFVSWPVWVMPVYYPMLSDHLAVAVSVWSLRAWIGRRTTALHVLTVGSLFIMPGLSLVPLALAALPYNRPAPPTPTGWKTWVFVLLAAGCLALLIPLGRLSDAQILNHPEGTTLGLPAFRIASTFVLEAALLCIAALWTRLLCGRVLWQRLAWGPLAVGCIGLALAAGAVWEALDWQAGFKGPSLLQNLLLQGMAAPGKPLVAHLLYFGPAFVLALVHCVRGACTGSAEFPLLVIVTAFLPLLVLGSESRQWIYLFPLLVTLAIQQARSWRTQAILVAWALLFAAAFLTLSRTGDSDLPGSVAWAYLLYQGPWMHNSVYTALVMTCLLASACAVTLQLWRRKAARPPIDQ